MPPKKATKRSATTVSKDASAPKQIKKKSELVFKPNLRNVPTSGIILSVGQGDTGQLGLGEDVMEKSRPAQITGYNDVIMIAAGGMHNVCLTKSGKVLTFGCNDEGALGRETTKEGSETVPGVVNIDGKVIQVTAGDSHSAVLLSDGKVFAWGSFRDSHGSMGLTINGNERLPVDISPANKIVKIASGADHLVMLTENGQIYTCGCGEQGQLGRVSSRMDRHHRYGIENLLKPNLVQFKVTKKLYFMDIWAGQYCTFAKESSQGDIYVFGLNNYHQIGLESTVPYFHPRISKTFNGKQWQHISSGQHHTLALDDDGDVYVMGRKEYGRLGLGSDCSDAEELTKLEKLNVGKIIDVSTGSAQSFAVNDAGQLYAWGMGSSGQLGTGTEDDVDEPKLVKSKQLEGKTVVRVSGGGQHTLILASVRSSKEKIID